MTNLKVTPYDDLEAVLTQEKEDFKPQKQYNTAFHSRSEIENALPSLPNGRTLEPSEKPWVLVAPWLDLMLTSRGVHASQVHRIILPGSFLVLLKHASEVGLQMGHVPQDDEEDLAQAFPKTTVLGENIEEVIGRARFFARLDACSLKDALIGQGPLMSFKDLWTRLATSARGRHGINQVREMDMPAVIYLFPWDDTMKTELEYRVFCPPKSDRVVAISQYKWHSRWYHADASFQEQERIAATMVEECHRVHRSIVESGVMTDVIRERGFVFDVVEDPETQMVRLIELNEFGATTGCGSCMFHWIEDARLLYGLEEGVEVPVTC